MLVHVDYVADLPVDPRFPGPITRAEWDRRVRAGELEGERVELLRGRVVRMSPRSERHINVVARLVRALNRQLDDAYRVAAPGALATSEDSAPEPDVMVTRDEPGRRDHATEALLVVEVAISSLRYDRGPKLEVYAAAGVPEYWIVDVGAGVVEVFTAPERAAARYGQVAVLREDAALRPALLPGFTIRVADLLR